MKRSPVRRAREEAGYTCEQVAALAGVTLSTVRNLEAQRTSDPRLSTARRFAKALGSTVDDLFPEAA